ncbi:MAG TPA: hypothetical protein VMC09_06680 [Anaerolineales bacterium]|nr:hypothetical protein [Anaerolineales bacterium]
MNDSMYQLITGTIDLFLWGGKLVGEENLPRRGPAVFIGNHLDAMGPIAAACSIPLRLHPWIVADMMDRDLAPVWLQWDLCERQLHLKPPFSRWMARAICKVAVPLFYSLGCIPVYRGDYDRMQQVTLAMSMDVLRQDKFLLVFPEDNRMAGDPLTRMQPFQRTFVRLGEMYYEETGERLGFHPVAIHQSGYVVVGKPVAYDPLNPVGLERHRLKDLMEDSVRALYLQMERQADRDISLLTPQHK